MDVPDYTGGIGGAAMTNRLTVRARCGMISVVEVNISQSWAEVPLFVSRDLDNHDWRTNRGTSAFTSEAMDSRAYNPTTHLAKSIGGLCDG